MNKQEAAREWLIENDPEAAEFWRNLPEETEFLSAYRANIREYGKKRYTGQLVE